MTSVIIDHRITKKSAEQITGTLSFPRKMPGTSYGIPAQACHVTKRFVSAVTRGYVNSSGIVLLLYRPRAGGIAYSCELDLDQAQALYSQLDESIALMTAKPERE